MRLPKERRAATRASSSLSPCPRRRSISSCRWASISELKSSSLRLRPNMALTFRRLRPELFVSQRDQRIHAYRAPRRNITSKQSDTDEKKGDTRKRQRIRRPHAVEQSCH